jgi:tetratricopeptide (TPR) repeat protein
VKKVNKANALLTLALVLLCGACARETRTAITPAANSSATSALAPLRRSASTSTNVALRFLEDRVKSDPDDLVAFNKLGGYYLQLHKETEDVRYLQSALASAHASLRILPVDQNLGGLKVLGQAEFETHNFVAARDHARELTEYEPRKAFAFQLLGDALLELGDYDQAAAAYERLLKLDPASVATETRWGRLAWLRGELSNAREHYSAAIQLAKDASIPAAETTAWCLWQFGELSFNTGDYDGAEKRYREALAAFPNYPHAVTSLARVLAAKGDLNLAIQLYEGLLQNTADPVDAAALLDLYNLVGRSAEAERMLAVVERTIEQSQLNSALYNRHLVSFWANHDRRAEDAYTRARTEYEVRRDVYGADALAWSALKAGKIPEASEAMKQALKLGTNDATLFYHAGMIARAAGDQANARVFLQKAIALSPQFDPLQVSIAKKVLENSN